MGESPHEIQRCPRIRRNVRALWFLYALWIVASLIVFLRPLAAVIRYAAHNDDASHIFLIPFISAGMIYLDRRAIFGRSSYDFAAAAYLGLAAAAVGTATLLSQGFWSPSEDLSGYMFALVLLSIAGFTLFFGRDATSAARFSLLLLFLVVPLPDFFLRRVVYLLQSGSAEIVAALFDLTGVPYLREGFIFDLGSISIEIAEECSGIRSSMGVLILALLAAHLYLRTFWKQSLFVLCSLFIMIAKNGIRIATLSVLALYVDPSFLFGRLHREGGIVFFLLGLALLLPILRILARTETFEDKDVTISASKAHLKF